MSIKKKPIKELHVIYDPDEMWVLASPVRMDVLNAVCALKECSAGEIAVFTGRSRTSLYPHIEQLIEAGLIIEAQVRLAGKRYEQLYHPIAQTVATKHNSADPDNVAYHQAYGKAVGRLMSRLYERAAANPDAVVRGKLRDAHAGTTSAWVNDESLEKINGLIDQIWGICQSSKPGEEKRLINLGIVLTPNSQNHSKPSSK